MNTILTKPTKIKHEQVIFFLLTLLQAQKTQHILVKNDFTQ